MKYVRENELLFSMMAAVLMTAGLLAVFRFSYVPSNVSVFHTEFLYMTSALYYFYIAMFTVFCWIASFIVIRWLRIRWELRQVNTEWIGEDALTINRLKELDDKLYNEAQTKSGSIFVLRLSECIEHIRQALLVNGAMDLRFIIEHSENKDDDSLVQTYRLFEVMVYIILFIGFSAFSFGIADAIGSLANLSSDSSNGDEMGSMMKTMALKMASASNSIKYSFLLAMVAYGSLAYVRKRNQAALATVKTAVIRRFYNRLPADVTRQQSVATDRPLLVQSETRFNQ